MKKCYSTNNEDFTYTDCDAAIQSALDDPEIKVGDVVTIYEGDSIEHKAGDFAAFWPIDKLKENANEECGEYSESWLTHCTKEQEGDLEDRIKAVVNQWADDYALHPNFYGVENIKEIKVELLDEDGNYKIADGDQK